MGGSNTGSSERLRCSNPSEYCYFYDMHACRDQILTEGRTLKYGLGAPKESFFSQTNLRLGLLT